MTAYRSELLGAMEFSILPLNDAIKTVKGDGSRVMATFEDPNCGYCKKHLQKFAKIDNVTTYTFLISILSPDSTQKNPRIFGVQKIRQRHGIILCRQPHQFRRKSHAIHTTREILRWQKYAHHGDAGDTIYFQHQVTLKYGCCRY